MEVHLNSLFLWFLPRERVRFKTEQNDGSQLVPNESDEPELGIDIVSHGRGQTFEMFRLANLTCTMKIYFTNWVVYSMLSASE